MRKWNTENRQQPYTIQLMVGTYICPMTCDGYLMRIFGQKLSDMASLISVYELVMDA